MRPKVAKLARAYSCARRCLAAVRQEACRLADRDSRSGAEMEIGATGQSGPGRAEARTSRRWRMYGF